MPPVLLLCTAHSGRDGQGWVEHADDPRDRVDVVLVQGFEPRAEIVTRVDGTDLAGERDLAVVEELAILIFDIDYQRVQFGARGPREGE